MIYSRLPKLVHILPAVALLVGLLVLTASTVSAITRLPTPPPIPGSYGLEATKIQAPPDVGARITTPSDGTTTGDQLMTVNGICPDDLLVQLYDNGVMVGATMCDDGSFSLQISLFVGANELVAMVYDGLDQAGPESNHVTVTYNATNFTAFADQVTLTSAYGRRAAPAGHSLAWPLLLSGGTGPYAFSIDWGDGSDLFLKSQATPGQVDIEHSYQKAGIYRISITVTDSNGATAFLQLVAIASGQVDATTGVVEDDKVVITKAQIMWLPYIILLILLLPTYWLGRRSQLVTIRNKLLRERDQYKKEAEAAVEKPS